MNDDLILRARLNAQGYSDEDIQKLFGGAGQASGKFTDRLPGGAKRQDKRMGQEGFTANNQAMITGQKQVDNQQAYADKMGAKGYETMTTTPTGMTDNTISAQLPKGAKGPSGNVGMSPQSAMNRGMTNAPPPPDGSVTGTTVPDEVTTKQTATMGADGNVANTKTTVDETMNANADTTGGGNGVTVQPATSQDSTGTGPTTQTPPQQQQAQGQGGPQVQGMAQQFQAGQDMQTIEQGKGAEKKGYFGGRSGLGMLADVATLGATSQFGSTGGIARRKANQQGQQQNQNYQSANQRMNQRSMGMNPQMVATSFDSQLSAYSDVLSLRKSIQERNTTTNLRR